MLGLPRLQLAGRCAAPGAAATRPGSYSEVTASTVTNVTNRMKASQPAIGESYPSMIIAGGSTAYGPK